jgi:hypothetical protein
MKLEKTTGNGKCGVCILREVGGIDDGEEFGDCGIKEGSEGQYSMGSDRGDFNFEESQELLKISLQIHLYEVLDRNWSSIYGVKRDTRCYKMFFFE